MTQENSLRGMAWDHPRAVNPLEAISAKWSQGSGFNIEWDARPLKDFEDRVGGILTDEERDEDIDTLGGLVFFLAGRVPVRGEVICHASGVEFEILDTDPRRVRRMRICYPVRPDDGAE